MYAPLTLACAWGHLTGTRVCNVLRGPRQRLKVPVLALRAVLDVHSTAVIHKVEISEDLRSA